MSKRYQILISTFAIVLSLTAVGLGCGLTAAAKLSPLLRFLFNLVFMTQFIATTWVVRAIFHKDSK